MEMNTTFVDQLLKVVNAQIAFYDREMSDCRRKSTEQRHFGISV